MAGPHLITAIVATQLFGAPAQPASNAAQRHFEAGRTRFDAGDFDAAIAHWTAARDAETSSRRAAARIDLDLALAHELDFDATGRPEALAEALALVQRYEDAIDAVYDEPLQRKHEHARASARRLRLQAKLQLASAPQSQPTYAASTDDAETRGDEVQASIKRKHRAMIGWGATLTVVGVGGLGVLAAGILRDNLAMKASGAVLAVGGGITGPVLIVFGRRRKRAALSDIGGRTGLALSWDRSGAGVRLVGRF